MGGGSFLERFSKTETAVAPENCAKQPSPSIPAPRGPPACSPGVQAIMISFYIHKRHAQGRGAWLLHVEGAGRRVAVEHPTHRPVEAPTVRDRPLLRPEVTTPRPTAMTYLSICPLEGAMGSAGGWALLDHGHGVTQGACATARRQSAQKRCSGRRRGVRPRNLGGVDPSEYSVKYALSGYVIGLVRAGCAHRL